MFPYERGVYVEIHLAEEVDGAVLLFDHLLVEGVPVRRSASVRERDHQYRQSRLSEKHVFYQGRIRLNIALVCHFTAVFPEGVPVYEEIPEFRILSVRQKIPELRGSHRKMVQDEVELEAYPHASQGIEILFLCDDSVYAVILHGKAAVEVCVVQARQYVHR